MPKQKVGAGETLTSLAKSNGFFWKTIWEHGENAALREKRKDPSVLFADDDIFIPELDPKKYSKSTDATHNFKRKGEPCKFKVQLFANEEPRKNEAYVLKFGAETINGKTDADGKIEHFVPGDLKEATLILRDGQEVHSLQIGDLDPLEEPSGVQQRLNNLGFNCPQSGELDDDTKEALKKFQANFGLEATGEVNGPTKAKLIELSK